MSANHRTIIVEVDGYKGHGVWYRNKKGRLKHESRHNKMWKDIRREKDIKNAHGKFIEFYRFTIWELLVLTDDEIFEELGF